MKRRSLILGSVAGALGLGALLRPRDVGQDHAPYFRTLSAALDNAGQAKPTLVVDRERLLANIQTLMSHISDRFAYRIVVKSLPSVPLLETVMQVTGSNRLMLFHQPFINRVATQFPQADILLGKPMPVMAARNFYRQFPGGAFEPQRQLRWLLDTPERVAQYDALAQSLGQEMPICIELDVGLHRGGVRTDEQLVAMLDQIQKSQHLRFSGLMGYEPHIVKVPLGDPITYRDRAMALYQHYVDVARNYLGDAWPQDVVLNAGGSPTYQLYDQGEFPFNELATGSCLVKPTDFDMPTLADHKPRLLHCHACTEGAGYATDSWYRSGRLAVSVGSEQGAHIFYLRGLLESAAGVSAWPVQNPLYGRSTNQEMLNGSRSITLRPDDWVFLRPTQSEFVFLQFGDIAVYDGGKIVDYWPVFTQTSA